MPYKQLLCGFYGEGTTDTRYFPVLLQRYIDKVCREQGIDADIFPVLDNVPKVTGKSFIEEMREVKKAFSGLELIFVHLDADSRSSQQVLTNKWQPWLEVCNVPDVWLPIIPVKMLESWLLADRVALEETFIITSQDLDVCLSNMHPERLPAPKDILRDIQKRGKQKRTRGFERLLAQRTRFTELEKLISFQEFAKQVEDYFEHWRSTF